VSSVRWFVEQAGVEQVAVAQIMRTASMPFVRGVAVMPDCHYGRGSTVGTVVATKGAVMPACVGVDIGCGMIAVRTSLSVAAVMPHLAKIRAA
jgi:tRNA-splicing ligase RtcB